MGGGSEAGDALAERYIAGSAVCAPHLIDAEVGQVIRRFVLRGEVGAATGAELLGEFVTLPIRRFPHAGLLERAFELHEHATLYDGLYLALAEALDCPLLTGDRAQARVPGCTAAIEVLTTSA